MSNPEPQEDLRVRRTRKLLMEALISLTLEQGFTAVSVRAITERAMVNRGTFYHHYEDKYDLVRQHIAVLLEELQLSEGALPLRPVQRDQSEPLPEALRFLEHIERNRRFYQTMLGRNGMPGFADLLQQYLERSTRQQLAELAERSTARMPVALMARAVASATVGAVVWWLEQTPHPTPAQMAIWSVQMIGGGLGYALGLEG
jgi:AcrR family transcriptional regulator